MTRNPFEVYIGLGPKTPQEAAEWERNRSMTVKRMNFRAELEIADDKDLDLGEVITIEDDDVIGRDANRRDFEYDVLKSHNEEN